MPIRPELRHFYRGPHWQTTRERILKRAGNKCEQCRKPNGKMVFTVCCGSTMYWARVGSSRWRNHRGAVTPVRTILRAIPTRKPRMIRVVLTIAHLDHTPGHDDDNNLRAWCQWCHLHHDQPHHIETRAATRVRKLDAARPLLQAMEVS
ncbi:MAG: hypothetical protein ACM3S5_12345 [Rhodospirillales bacterium]